MKSAANVSSQALIDAFKGTDLTLRSAADRHIDHVLEIVDGNISAAAKLLGVHRRSLQRKIASRNRRRRRRRARR